MTKYVFDTKHDHYPVAVHVFLIDAIGRILLMRRAGSGFADGQLGLPAGHVDLGGTPTASAVREVGEELGIGLDPQELGRQPRCSAAPWNRGWTSSSKTWTLAKRAARLAETDLAVGQSEPSHSGVARSR